MHLRQNITVYMDGSYHENLNGKQQTESGIWYNHTDPRNLVLCIPGENQSNQVGELAAALYTIKETVPFTQLNIISD